MNAMDEQDLATVHGGLICYDTTNRDSMDCLPDLLSMAISKQSAFLCFFTLTWPFPFVFLPAVLSYAFLASFLFF